MINTSHSTQSWTAYWQHSNNMGACLPKATGDLDKKLNATWENLAKKFLIGSKIVDLACGVGKVGLILLETNPSLEILGVDYADIHVKTPFKIFSNTNLSNMPFKDDEIDHSVSQFGFEYSDKHKAAIELSRVTRTGGTCTFVMHHEDSIVVKQNVERYKCLTELSTSEVWAAAKSKNVQKLQKLFDALINEYGETELVMQIATAIRESLNLPTYQQTPFLESLVAAMNQESEIINQLKAASLSKNGVLEISDVFGDSWKFSSPENLTFDNKPLAWILRGEKTTRNDIQT